jgi:hypothetical protein
MIAKRLILSTLVMFLCSFSPAHATDREWRDGKVTSIDQTEQPIIRAPKKERTDTTQYNSNQNSSNSTSTTTTTVSGGPTGRSVKTYWYTVTDGTKYYVARITANLFNVTTAAKVDVGGVKFAIDGKNLILQGTDGKEYKAEIVRTSLTPPTTPPDPGPPIIQED